jgi:hypothetical protein
MDLQLEKKIEYSERSLSSALSRFILSNKRVDRDRVLTVKSKVDTLKELLKEQKTNGK